ncbi:MAG: LacI family transcriptional regulator, partial [Burkholderiaceae bacterium]|nr:LacI family transcriptional regulator [Microbacteriaceae bacterium]
VSFDKRMFAERTLALLVARMANPHGIPTRVTIPHTVIARASTATRTR